MLRQAAAIGISVCVIGGVAWADAFSDCATKTDLDQRIKSCTEAITQSAGNKRQLTIAYNLRGSAYAQKGDFDRAIIDLTKGIELEPRDAIVYAARGEAYRFKGDLARAIADFDKAIELDVKHITAYHSRGLAYFAKRDAKRAIPDLSKAIEIDPRSARARHDRAFIHEALGQKEQAIADFRSALQLDPNHKASQEGLKRLGSPTSPQQQQTAAEFSRLMQRVQQTADAEQRIALAEEALRFEPRLNIWPFQMPRETAKGELLFHLGASYQRRQQGDRADNLEKAIAAYEQSLAFWRRETDPQGWALIQHNLALAYSNRLRGSPAENLEKAIAGNQLALSVRTREAMPLDWAQTQYNLGLVYVSRVRGDHADNLEKAIAAYEASLTVRTRESHPELWARTTHSLAAAYHSRIRGERADNIERAIAGFEGGLTVLTRDKYPREWADAQDNLGSVYSARIRGERADNLERSLAAYQAALTARTREANPEAWAQSQINLGATLNGRIRGDRADNQEKAIAAYQAALTVYTRAAAPQYWAATQSNIAVIHLNRVAGDRAGNIERAISGFEAAHAVFTREAYPREWAGTSRSLADAYRVRVRGDRSVNLAKAIAGYEAALGVQTRDAFPRDHLRTAQLLAGANLETGDWRKAGLAAASAREAFLLLFGQGLDETGAAHLIEAAGPLFADAAFTAAQRGEAEAALALAAEGRARLMAVSLRLYGLDLDPMRRRRLEELRTAIREQSQAYDTTSGLERTAALDKLAALRREMLTMVQEADRSAAKGAEGIAAAAARLVPDDGAIVVPVITKAGAVVLILSSISQGNPLAVLKLPELTTERLDKLMRGDGKVGAGGGWLGAFNVQYLPANEFSARIGEWTGAIERIGSELWGLFAGRLDAALQERGVKAGARVVWLPTGALGLLPLGLAHDPARNVRLGEKYELVTAPGLEALAQAARQTAQAQQPSLAAVVNPTGDLPFTEVESALVAAHFTAKPHIMLDKSTATPRAVLAGLKDKSYWHFSSHGRFDWENARRAGLIMKDAEALTIGALLDAEGSLGRPRLVVLSACETGLYDTTRNADEFVGLPATFLQLGAAGVLGTLWQVDDLATSLLMARFYDLHLAEGLAPPAALVRAQAWLRSASRDELLAYARSAAAAAKLDAPRLAQLEDAVAMRRHVASSRFDAIAQRLQARDGSAAQPAVPTTPDANKRPPFEHPYYWGGFVYTGL